MPKLLIQVPHRLSQDEATERLKVRIEEAKLDSRIGKVSEVVEIWENPHNLKFSFKVYGFGVSGVMSSKPEQVDVDFLLPFAAIMFQGMIKEKVHQELSKVLG